MLDSLYIKTFFRDLVKNKIYFSFNLFGLVVGFLASIFIFLNVFFENSYDSMHKNAKNIYRISLAKYQGSTLLFNSAMTYPVLGPYVNENMPEVTSFLRLKGENGFVGIKDSDVRHKEFEIFYADESFFEFFTFPLVQGNVSTALSEPNTVVLTESTAKKYFGNENPIDKVLMFDGSEPYRVTGVMKDLPKNSHLALNFLFSFSSLDRLYENIENNWQLNEFYTYITLADDTDVSAFENKINKLAIDNKGDKLIQANRSEKLFVQQLQRINLESGLLHQIKEPKSMLTIIFSIISGFVILIIAWINYVNITTIRALERIKEIGIKKILGAKNWHLRAQFIVENALVNLFALILSVILLFLLKSYLFDYLDYQLFIDNPLLNPMFWIMLIGIWLLGILISGVYPAFVVSSFEPISAIQGKFSKSSKGKFVRKALVAAQFLVTMVLLGSVLVVSKQINFMLSADKGISTKSIFAIESPRVFDGTENFESSYESFKQELLKRGLAESVSFTSLIPGKENYWIEPVRLDKQEANQNIDISVAVVDYDFIKTFDVEMLKGRFFSRDFPSHDRAVIANKAAMDILSLTDLDEALNRELIIWDGEREIVGVMKNYNNLSLKQEVDPTIYLLRYTPRSYAAIKIRSNQNYLRTINDIGTVWDEFFPRNPFEYFLVDETYQKQYADEDRFLKIFKLSTILSLIIAFLGLYSLSLYETLQKTKEIGIRKSLGASTFQVVYLFVISNLKLVGVVFFISIPIIYFSMNNWLSYYTQHINPGIWVYIFAGFTLALISLVATIYQSFRAAKSNVVESLKYD